jgi:hypothetical protein
MIRALFTEWWSHYGEQPVVLSDLADSVTRIVNPPGADGVPQHSRQWVESRIRSFVGTRVGPFTLVRNKAAAKWSTANYMLTRETATAKEQFVDVADVFDKQQQMPF